MLTNSSGFPNSPQPLSLPESVCHQTAIILPAYNEGTMVSRVIEELKPFNYPVVVIDDGSTDDTFEQARAAGAVVLRHAVNRGQGAALQTGLEYSLRRGAEYMVTFDSDGQHCVADIPRLVFPLCEGQADIVLGSRFLGRAENIPLTRWFLLKAAVLFTRVVSHVKITDTHNGLRAFSRRAASKMHITLDRMAHASEIIDQIGQLNLPFTEIPVHIRYTDYSRMKGQRSLAAVNIVTALMFKRLFA